MSSVPPGVPGTGTCALPDTEKAAGQEVIVALGSGAATAIAALRVIAGAPSCVFIAVACACTAANGVRSWGVWLSHSPEAGTDPGNKGGGERRNGLGKNTSRNPQAPTGEQC